MDRAQLIRLINVGRAKLGWDEDLYRALLARFGGQADADGRVSLKSLTDGQMQALLDHQRTSGFRPVAPQRPAQDKAALVAKVRALLINVPGGARSDAYADAMALRMFQVEKFTWCTPMQLHKLVAALAIDSRRRSKS